MARYRKIDTRIWNDEKFNGFSDDAQLVFLFLLTHPHMTSLGAMRASIPGLAAEKGWPDKRFTKGFEEPFLKGMVRHDKKASFLWLTNFIKYNPPNNPNVVKSYTNSLDLLPECSLKDELIQYVKWFVEQLPKPFSIALPEQFLKGMAIQEQEQEQEFKETPCIPLVKNSKDKETKAKTSRFIPRDFVITDDLNTWAVEHAPHVNVKYETEKLMDWEFKSARTDWGKVWRNWMRRAEEDSNGKMPSSAKPVCKHNRGQVPDRYADDGSVVYLCSHCREEIKA